MTMRVRSKMTCNTGVSDRPYVNFHAVYEGSKELQTISENSIFGDATPMGTLQLDPADHGPRFVNGEDYYVDLTLIEPREGALVKRKLRLAYITPEADRALGRSVMFRYVSLEVCNAHLELGILNVQAWEALEAHAEVWMALSPATGRRTDLEIALRRKALAEHLTDPYGYGKSHPDSYAVQTARLERALRRSEGLDY